MSYHLELVYPSVVGSEAKLVQCLKEVLAANRVTGEEQRVFTLVISEAFTNALIHGNEFDAEKTIKICLDINDCSLRADIIDEGRGGLMKVSRPRCADPFADGGRGIGLIEHFVTEVQFEETRDGGLKVSIMLERKELTNSE